VKQPLIAVALCYGAGVVLGHFVEAPLVAAFTVAIALTLAALATARLRPLLLPLLLLLTGWANLSSRTALLSPDDLRTVLGDEAQLVTARGRIISTPVERVSTRNEKEAWRALAEMEIREVRLGNGEWQRAWGRMMSRTSGHLASNVFVGQTVEVVGIANIPPPPIAEGVFDYARYLRQRGIHYELKVESEKDWRVIGHASSPPLSDRFRAWGQKTLARGLPEQDESLRLQWAMLLGWQTALTAEVSEPFMRSGTMHIFAISGLHIALIAGIFVALLRALTVPRVACGLIVVPILWFYTSATGWQPSAIRSAVMMSVILLGWSLKRPTDLLNSLAMAACVILVWQPEQLFQAGFQLSFFVVLSIALLSPPIEKWLLKFLQPDPLLPDRLRSRWQRALLWTRGHVWKFTATSLAALIGSAPLIAYYFHLLTPGSLIANLIVVPVSSLALMSGLGALITGDWFPYVTELFNFSGWFWMRLMIFFSETAANLPASWCHVRAPGPLVFTFYYGALFALCAGWVRHPVRRWVLLGAFLIFAGCWLTGWARERAWHHLTALPLGGGHAIHVQPRDTEEWLIDAGDKMAFQFTLKPYLQAQGVNRLDNLLLTHGDARQVGSAPELHQIFPVRQAWASPLSSRSPVYQEALSKLETAARLKRSATNGYEVAPWKFLHPDTRDRFTTADDNTVVTLGTFDGVRVLLASDLGKLGQNALFARHPDLRADIVIAGLPTRGEPLATEWLAALRPKWVIIMDSEIPATRRASQELMKRLRRSGASTLFTRETGAVTLSIRDGAWRVQTARPVAALEP
jgi:competence protein ComEC